MAAHEDARRDWRPGSLDTRREVVVRCGGDETYVVTQDPNSAEPGAQLWDVSVIFARLVAAGVVGDDVAGRRVLELGAGCAVAGPQPSGNFALWS